MQTALDTFCTWTPYRQSRHSWLRLLGIRVASTRNTSLGPLQLLFLTDAPAYKAQIHPADVAENQINPDLSESRAAQRLNMLTVVVWVDHVRMQHEPSPPCLLSCSYRTISQTPTVTKTTKPRTMVMTAESSAAPHSTSPMVGCAQPCRSSVT